MTHPITPPPELVQEWFNKASRDGGDWPRRVAAAAAQWGADQELEACCKLMEYNFMADSSDLRAARRPKPLTLKEQALRAARIELDPNGKNGALILRALEALPDD